MDLYKAYNALDWEQYMWILVAYGARLRTERLICRYWEVLTMVSRVGRYYITPFKVSRGYMQSDPLSTTIFNRVGDTVIHHREMVADGEDSGTEGL